MYSIKAKGMDLYYQFINHIYISFLGFSRSYLNHLILFQSELNTMSNVVSIKRFPNQVLEGFLNFDLTTEH